MIKFVKLRLPAFIFSGFLILVGLWFFLGSFFVPKDFNIGPFTPRGLNLGIDFQGGLVHQVTVYSGIDQDEIRAFALDSGLGQEVQNVVISENRQVGKAKSYLIKTIITKEEQKIISDDPEMTPAKFLSDRTKKFHKLIKEKYGDKYILKGEELKKANSLYNKGKITGEIAELGTTKKRVLQNVVKESENVISPVYSEGLRLQAIGLVLFVLAIFLVYITIRFQFKYAVGAIFALLHDVLIIMGFITFTYLEFDYTIVAALLFIIGYSINDTIVIFDRVRENYGIMKDSLSIDVINVSVNQSLSRTIITSVTTLLAVLALYIWGGPKINGFAVTLIAGIFCGTYSSIFIAAPVVDSWEMIFSSKKKKKELVKKEEKQVEKKELKQESKPDSVDATNNEAVLSKKQLMKISGKKKKKKK